MLRRLFTLASTASFLLCTSTVLFWVRSNGVDGVDDCLAYQTDTTFVFLASCNGYIVWGSAQCSEPPQGCSFTSGQALVVMMMVDFDTVRDRSGHRISWWWKWTPCYAVAGIASLLPICWAVAMSSRRRVMGCGCCLG